MFQDSYTVPDNVCFIKNCELLGSREGGCSKGMYRWGAGRGGMHFLVITEEGTNCKVKLLILQSFPILIC